MVVWVQHGPKDVCARSLSQSYLTLCDPLGCTPPGSSVHGILQARILEWVAMPFSGDIPNPGIEPRSPALAGRLFTTITTWEAYCKGSSCLFKKKTTTLFYLFIGQTACGILVPQPGIDPMPPGLGALEIDWLPGSWAPCHCQASQEKIGLHVASRGKEQNLKSLKYDFYRMYIAFVKSKNTGLTHYNLGNIFHYSKHRWCCSDLQLEEISNGNQRSEIPFCFF